MIRKALHAYVAAFVVVAALVAGPVAAAELTIVSKTKPAKGSPTTTTQYITPEKMLVSDGRTDTLVDLEGQKMVQIDHKKKKYSEVTFEQMRAQFAELEEMIQSNPMMEKMLGSATEVEVEKAAGSREIAGYTCQKYVLTIGKSVTSELWVTSELQAPAEYYDAQKMPYAAMGPMATRFEKLYDKMKEIGGVALASTINVKAMGMNMETTSEAQEVRVGDVPESVFAIPAGYKKGKSPFGK